MSHEYGRSHSFNFMVIKVKLGKKSSSSAELLPVSDVDFSPKISKNDDLT